MKKSEDKILEKIASLYGGIDLYKVHVDRTREQDKNAQVMDKRVFELLTKTIQEDNRLESMPYGYLSNTPKGEQEFVIVSGHHRVRAARKAGVTVIYVLVDTKELTSDQIKSKQLAHNSLSGMPDKQLEKEIYDSIADINAKIRTGLADSDTLNYAPISLEDLKIEFDYEFVKLLFLKSDLKKFDEVLSLVEENEHIYVASISEWQPFSEAIRLVSKRGNIRNVGGIITEMCRIIVEYYETDITPKAKKTKEIGFKKS